MRIERRHAGRRIRKMRRLSKRLKPGYLYYAPLGQPLDADPEVWTSFGATDEGFSWPEGWTEMEPGDSFTAGPILGDSFPLVFTPTREVSTTFDLGEQAPRD